MISVHEAVASAGGGLAGRCIDRIRSIATERTDDRPDVDRRAFLRRAGAAGAVATVGAGAASSPAAAEVGEPCDWDRTDDRNLPWETGGDYGGWGGHEYWGTEAGAEKAPVVFVHGNGAEACAFDGIAEHLRNHGWRGDELWSITFREYTTDHEEMRDQFDDFVQHVLAETGAEAVDVVSHSLGVTGVRYWMDDYDRFDWVNTFVGMAGANHGVCVCPGCFDATLGEDYDGLLGGGEVCQFVAIQCFAVPGHPLYEINLPDETPGDVDYYTMRGIYDPFYYCNPWSPYLTGAQNDYFWTRHMGLLEQADAIRYRLS